MTFPLDVANMAAIWFEAVFYGIYLVLFFYTCYVLYHPRPGSKRNTTNWTLFGACVTLLIFSTVHVGASLRMLFEAFIFRKTFPGGASAYFADEGMVLSVLRKGVFAASVLVADVLMIYRCYVLWHRNWLIVIFPILTLCLTVITTCFIATQLINYVPSPATGIFTPQLDTWIPTYFIIAFTTNFYLSLCIAWKLWRASRKAEREMLRFKKLFITIVVVESNSIYPFMNVLSLMLFLAKSNIQVIPVNILAQVIAIAPTLMILQVQMGLYSSHSDFGLDTATQSCKSSDKPDFTDFTRPYAFIPVPPSPGVHFPSLSRTLSMKTFRKSVAKGEGRVAYTTYGGSVDLPPIELMARPSTRRASTEKRGIVVTSTVDVYDTEEAGDC